VQEVPGRPRFEQTRGERLAKPRNVDLERRRRGRRRPFRPDGVEEVGTRYDAVRPEEEDGEHGPLLRPPEREAALAVERLDRTEHAVLHLALV
jgi:hypothetical protein